MNTTPTYHVLPNNAMWEVIRDFELVGSFQNEDDAVEFVRYASHKHGPARVIVHTWAYDLEQEIIFAGDARPSKETSWRIK